MLHLITNTGASLQPRHLCSRKQDKKSIVLCDAMKELNKSVENVQFIVLGYIKTNILTGKCIQGSKIAGSYARMPMDCCILDLI
jgi:hypothetical protein